MIPDVVNQLGDTWDAPVKGPSIAFAILFAITGIWHVVQNFKYKAWLIMWLIPCACILLIAGCICREFNAFHPSDNNMLSAIQGLFYSGAVVISAALYMLLFFLFRKQPGLDPLNPRMYWVICNLFLCAIISLTAQGSASYFNPNATHGAAKSGHILLEVSLIMMLVLTITFLGLLLEFHRRCSSAKVFESGDGANSMNTVFWTLYITGLLMLVRDIFRTAQIFSSTNSLAWTSEALFWVFDAVPLLLCLFVLNVSASTKLFRGSHCRR